MGKTKRKGNDESEHRQKKFNEREKAALLSAIEARLGLVRKDMDIERKYETVENTARAWDEIAIEVSTVRKGVVRTGPQVRTKWTDYKSVVKRKAQAIIRQEKATDSGPVSYDELTPLELRVVKLIGETTLREIADTQIPNTLTLDKKQKKQKLPPDGNGIGKNVSYTPSPSTSSSSVYQFFDEILVDTPSSNIGDRNFLLQQGSTCKKAKGRPNSSSKAEGIDRPPGSVVSNQGKLNDLLGSILNEMAAQREQNSQFLMAFANHLSNTNNILVGIHNALVTPENRIDPMTLSPTIPAVITLDNEEKKCIFNNGRSTSDSD